MVESKNSSEDEEEGLTVIPKFQGKEILVKIRYFLDKISSKDKLNESDYKNLYDLLLCFAEVTRWWPFFHKPGLVWGSIKVDIEKKFRELSILKYGSEREYINKTLQEAIELFIEKNYNLLIQKEG
jgi:hypothetical protein